MSPTPVPDWDPAQVTHELATAIAQLREVLAPIDEAAKGYRKQLEEDGWSPTVAESMALEFHRMMMHQLRQAGSS